MSETRETKLLDELLIAVNRAMTTGSNIALSLTVGRIERELRTPKPPINLPFERVPQHATDPGFGPVPPESNVTSIRQIPASTPSTDLRVPRELVERVVQRLSQIGYQYPQDLAAELRALLEQAR